MYNYNYYGVHRRRCRLSAAVSTGSATALTTAVGQETLIHQTYHIQLPQEHKRDKNLVPGVRDLHTTLILSALQPTMLDNYVPLEVVGDGNCLYRAVCRALYGKEDMHKLLRLMTTIEIACHQASYDPERTDFDSDIAMYVPA